MDILYVRGKSPANGKTKPISDRTLALREKIMFMCMKQIRALGFKIDSVYQLKGRHIQALVDHWVGDGLSAGTIQNRLSVLRVLCNWLGKDGMIQATEKYAEQLQPGLLKRETVATEDKSWSASNIDIFKVIELADEIDPYVAMQLRVIHAFGLRREESIQFKPHRVDEGDVVRIRDGTKGGRERLVRVVNDYQREVLEMAKARVKTLGGHLGAPGKSLEQNLRRFAYVMEKLKVTKKDLGVTAHGLRHQRLNDIFEEVAGVPSPVRQMSAADGDNQSSKEIAKGDQRLWDRARQIVSSEAGHARLSISGAYTGSARSVKKPRLDWTVNLNALVSKE
jgi:integrase